MKKIRLANGSEYEIYYISESSGTLKISILDADSEAMEEVLRNADNTSVIQYYVGIDLMKGYARYTKLSKYEKLMDQLISIDYNTPDETTESGFSETHADILSIYLERVESDSAMDALAADVAELKTDVAAINAVLEGATDD